MREPNQMEMFDGVRLRDEALGRVSTNAGTWFLQAMAAVQQAAHRKPGRFVTGEDLRVELTKLIGAPHHHNTWGAVIKFSLAAGWLKRVGETNMKDPRSHARETPLYELRSKR